MLKKFKVCFLILVRLEFEIKLEPLLLYSPAPATATAAATPALFVSIGEPYGDLRPDILFFFSFLLFFPITSIKLNVLICTRLHLPNSRKSLIPKLRPQ